MTTWRTLSSQSTQSQLDDLFNGGIGFAREQLARSGHFLPYIRVLDRERSQRFVAPSPDLVGEFPSSTDVLAWCRAYVSAKREDLQAFAVFFDAAGDKPAICADIEHRDGVALRILLPYERVHDGALSFGELVGFGLQDPMWDMSPGGRRP